MNSYLKTFLTGILFLSAIISGYAQPSLIVGDGTAPSGSNTSVNVRVMNFTGLVKVEFPVTWNPNELKFVGVSNLEAVPDLSLDLSNFDFSEVENGKFTFTYENNSQFGMTLPGNDEIEIFQIEFQALIAEGATANIIIPNEISQVTVIRNNADKNIWEEDKNLTQDGTITATAEIPDVIFTISPENEPSILCKGDQICYDLKVAQFDSILAMDFSLIWNGSVLKFSSIKNFGLPKLDAESFVVNKTGESIDSVATASWFPGIGDSEGLINGVTIPDDTNLATLCFDVIGENTSTTLEINKNAKLEIVNYKDAPRDLISNTQIVDIKDCENLISFSTNCQDIKLDETVCLDFVTSNFKDIVEAKYTVFFDNTLLEFVNTENHNPNLTGLDASNITIDGDRITFEWTNTTGATVENGATLFSACFKAIGAIDSVATIDYVKVLGALTNVTNSNGSLDPQFTDCEIKILPPTVVLTAPVVSAPPTTNICLELKVENFLNIKYIEMPIEWDPTVLEFVEVKTTGLTGLTDANFKFNNTANGRLELESWDSPTSAGITLPDGTSIYEICFNVIGNLGTESPVIFPESNDTPVFMLNANEDRLDIDKNDGKVTVETSGLILNSEAQEVRKNNAFCVDIQTSNFKEIVSAGYSHLYDPNVLRFDSVQVGNAISNLSSDNIVLGGEGVIRVAWTSDDNANGTTLADGTSIYALCFTTIGDLGACANFRLDTIQDITTISSAGDDIGTFDSTKDLCIDNFGMTVVDSLRPSCTGGDGQIRLTVSGDPGENFLYFVNKDGEPFLTGEDVENDSIILTNLAEGAYSIIVNSIVDVSKSETRVFNLTLSEADLPTIMLAEDIDAGCVEADASISIPLDGSNFTLPVSQGSNLYTTKWTALGTGVLDSLTDDNEMTTALAPGRYIYTVRITDNSCEASDTIEIITAQPPRVQVSQGGTLGCTNSTLELGLEVIDDNPNNKYLWTTTNGNIVSGNTSFTPTIDREGIYKFIATDTVNGCIGFDSTFVFTDTIKPEANAGPDLEMGCNDNSIELTGIGSTGAEVEWSTPDGSSIFYPDVNDQEVANVSRVGTYIFTVTNQVNGCQATDTMMINADNSLPVARAEDLAIIGCGADDVKLDGSESSQGLNFAYRWENPNKEPISTEDTIRTAIEGEYLLIVINIDNPNCIADTARIMVREDKTKPQTSISQSLILACQAECTPLSANVPDGDHYSYLWETDDGVLCGGEKTPTAMVQSVGVYKLLVKDLNNNCESTAASIVSDDGTGVSADPGPPRQIDCDKEIVTLDGRGSSITETTIISWKAEDGTEVSSEIQADIAIPGEYTLEIMDSETGCNAIGKVTVTESTTAPIAEAGEAPPVSGCEFPTGRRLNGTASELGDNITYAWTSTSGIIVGDTSIAAPEIGSPGIFLLTVTNTDNGCSSFDEVIVQSDVVIPVANAGGDKLLSCDKPELTLAGISEELAPGSVILWSTVDGNIIGDRDKLSVNIDAPGTYELSIESADGCKTTDEVIVDSNIDAPEANAGEALTISCNNSLVINGTGTIGDNIAIEWTTVGGNIISGADTYTPEINRGGSYTLTVLNTENNCPTTSLVIVSDSEALPIADAGVNQEICTNESVLSAVQPTGDYTGSWTTLEKSMVVSPDEANSMVADLAEGTNTYIWTLSNEDCGSFSSDTVLINVPTFPIAADDVFEIQPDQSFNTLNLIENDQVNSDMFNINILEQPSTGQLNEVGSGVFEFTTPARYFGTQQFQYEVCSAACSELCDIANVRVVVLPGADVDTTNTVPNAITPNGDGMNDMLLIDELIFDAIDFPKSELIIFNRWGDVVYKASPYNNDWQGTATNGDDLPEGTYYYILRLDIVEGETMKGDITILR